MNVIKKNKISISNYYEIPQLITTSSQYSKVMNEGQKLKLIVTHEEPLQKWEMTSALKEVLVPISCCKLFPATCRFPISHLQNLE
jgi:hypothetical protein